MPSTINADNGAISGSAGVKTTADSSGVLDLQTNGTTAVSINTSQNVGIGTSSPAYRLDVQNSASTTWLRIGNAAINSGAAIIFNGASTQKNWVIASQYNVNGGLEFTQTTAGGGSVIGSTPAMTLNASGNLGVGTDTPTSARIVSTVSDSGTYQAAFNATNNANADFQIRIATGLTSVGTSTSTPLIFQTGATERARIQSGGTFLVSADGVGSYATAAFGKAGVADSVTTNLFTINATNNSIYGFLEIQYAISDTGNDLYVGRKTYRVFHNAATTLLDAITTEAYSTQPTFSATGSGATVTIRINTNTASATYGVNVAVCFTQIDSGYSVIQINEA